MYCPRCNQLNPEGTATCRSCGSPMVAATLVAAAPQGGPRPRVALRIVRADGGPETVFPMTGEVLTCGRKGDLALPDDPFVAQTQARFFFSGSKLAIEDVGGGNGIFVRLRGEREVPAGGEIRVGRQRLIAEPLSAVAPGAGGTVQWGSPDPGYRLRMVQMIEGGTRGQAFPLKDGENQLGRENGDITFPGDGFVSGRHAVLTVRQDRLTVKDQGSSNGTFVRLTAACFVDNGDQFLVGRELVRVEMQG